MKRPILYFLIGAVVMVACSGSTVSVARSASVWDKRDLNVQKADGIINGIPVYTLPTMRMWKHILKSNFSGDAKFEPVVRDFDQKFLAAENYSKNLTAKFKNDMTPESREIKELHRLIAEANEPMFELIREFARRGKSAKK